ncbi:MAG: hypothetical protein U0169_00935 [Polyangiaceae bacterium]
MSATFDVLDAVSFASIVKRSPTLDGSVPLRVAKACPPLLEGNAFGHQVLVREGPVLVPRRFGVPKIGWTDASEGEAIVARFRAAVRRLVAQGFLHASSEWVPLLARGPVFDVRRGGDGRVAFRMWTGHLVRPKPGTWLRVSASANRRHGSFGMEPTFATDPEAFVPLVIEGTWDANLAMPLVLAGELATVATVEPNAGGRLVPLRDVAHLADAHVAFYDPAYFADKRGDDTRKYRKAQDPGGRTTEGVPGFLVADAGRPDVRFVRASRFVHPVVATPVPESHDGSTLTMAEYGNVVTLEARFDGWNLVVTPDAAALARCGESVRSAFASVFDPARMEAHRRALWYLTKYVTPHPPGEPHFFVKPLAFTETPPGWSSLVEGHCGDGYDVLRGVVETDHFHATPAVFQVRTTERAVHVPAGTRLVTVFPVRRALQTATFDVVPFRDVS